jgi:uncharacterized protein (TIGR02646 family)
MRGILRIELQADTSEGLRRLQAEADRLQAAGSLNSGDHWGRNRPTPLILAVLATLQQMAGERERCMYCVDSLGPDIEHFWPKTPYPERLYVWENLLLVCTDCGRKKGAQFPLTAQGEPLLVDPSAEDPWEFLDFDPMTGNLNARYLLASDAFSAKGESTVKVLHLDRREGVAAGYRKTYSDLCRLVGKWTDQQWTDQDLQENYLEELRKTDDHGLLGWFLNGSGQNEPAFSSFRGRFPEAWGVCKELFH